MNQYQSFPGVAGASESLAKLRCLRLPPLQGKRFLDVGCNEGFFCGYAKFDGASEVVGIDRSRVAVTRAQARFPDCQFFAQSWEELPEGKFDLILLASALHYASDQEALIHRLMDALTAEGTLVLELGLAPSGANEWVAVKRSIDERLFPTRAKLGELLEPYAWKIIGHSVRQAGDPLLRYVVHVRRRKPFVYLMLATSASGKTMLRRRLFGRAKLPSVSGDNVYRDIERGLVPASARLTACISTDFAPQYDMLAGRVLGQGLVGDLVDVWCEQGGGGEFALDSYVPEQYQPLVKQAFIDRGYIPVTLEWEMEKTMSATPEANSKAALYQRALARQEAAPRAAQLRVTRLRPHDLARKISAWHLDRPVGGQLVGDENPLSISGWALPSVAHHGGFECYVRTGETIHRYPIDRPRPDVIAALVAKESIPVAPETLCGFRIDRTQQELVPWMEFGFTLNGEDLPAARFDIVKPASPMFRRLRRWVGDAIRARR